MFARHQLSHYGLESVTTFSTIAWSGTEYDAMFWTVTICNAIVWYGTKCDNVLARHHRNNIGVNADTNAKCNTVVHDNICGTKCNNNVWSYSGNGAKCGTIVDTVLLLWSYPGSGAKCVSRLFINPLYAHIVFEKSTDRE